jgi:hypothetical protein
LATSLLPYNIISSPLFLFLSFFPQSFLLPFIFLSISFFSSRMVSFSFNVLVCISAAFNTLVQATPTPGRHGAKVSGIGVPVSNENAKNIISNRYIVVYNNNASDSAVETHQASVMTALRKRNLIAMGKEGKILSSKMDAFSMSGWRGMSLEAEDSMILEIESATEVAYVEADTMVKTGALVSQASAPAGLRRISHAAAGSAGYIYDNSSGGGIVAYVVDTGIELTHAVSSLSAPRGERGTANEHRNMAAVQFGVRTSSIPLYAPSFGRALPQTNRTRTQTKMATAPTSQEQSGGQHSALPRPSPSSL